MMATTWDGGRPRRAAAAGLAADRTDRVLAAGSAILLATVAVAVARGRAGWGAVPPFVWVHLLTVVVALALTPAMLLRPRGDRWHRRLGTAWVAAMLATAITSLFVHTSGPGRWSVIHILSAFMLVQVPLIWWTARTHRVAQHRRAVRGTVIGALLVAGFFTFPFGRLMGRWLFG